MFAEPLRDPSLFSPIVAVFALFRVYALQRVFARARRVTHSPTLGEYNIHFVISTWKMSIFGDFTDMCMLGRISSRI